MVPSEPFRRNCYGRPREARLTRPSILTRDTARRARRRAHRLPRARLLDARARDRDRRASAERRAARLAERLLAAPRAGQIRGRRATPAPLVRWPRDAAPLHGRRRQGLLRQPLPAEPLLPRREGARQARLRRVRDRPMPLAVQARAEPVPAR